mmetsp:Transcript_27040/g.68141  ORF Transcript_27040/g.68141 Transcript_27040/m.68141 type:complete len:230 (-) Transcript_27040:11047-11736(-)
MRLSSASTRHTPSSQQKTTSSERYSACRSRVAFALYCAHFGGGSSSSIDARSTSSHHRLYCARMLQLPRITSVWLFVRVLSTSGVKMSRAPRNVPMPGSAACTPNTTKAGRLASACVAQSRSACALNSSGREVAHPSASMLATSPTVTSCWLRIAIWKMGRIRVYTKRAALIAIGSSHRNRQPARYGICSLRGCGLKMLAARASGLACCSEGAEAELPPAVCLFPYKGL